MNQLSQVIMRSGDVVQIRANDRIIEVHCQGNVVMIQDVLTDDVLLLGRSQNSAILGESVHNSKRIQENANQSL